MATKLDQALLTDGATVVRNLFDDDKIAKLLELYDYCFEHHPLSRCHKYVVKTDPTVTC